jgi:hypothetical protein
MIKTIINLTLHNKLFKFSRNSVAYRLHLTINTKVQRETNDPLK